MTRDRKRTVAGLIRSHLRAFPAVVLVGPRQSGKTTLAKTLKAAYFDLEKEEDRLRLEASWPEVVDSPHLVILDEAQTYPLVFQRLRSAIDERRSRKGRFLLLGSVAPGLMREVGESLAGRMAICELTPFLVAEVGWKAAERHWIRGGFPDGGRPGGFPLWQESYLQLLAQRDLPNWGLPAKPAVTSRLFKMLAALHAEVWNASELAGSLGLSYHTVNSYLDYLEGAFLIRRLPPLHANIRKRLVKSPKVYWRDSGLLHSLLGFRGGISELLSRPWVGRSWEGWVIEQVISTLASRGVRADPYYFRTSEGKEIDLVLDFKGRLLAIEVKLTALPSEKMFQSLNDAADLIGAGSRILISRTRSPLSSGSFCSTHLQGAIRVLSKL